MSKWHGVELSGHESSQICLDDRDWAQVIVLMDRSIWARLRRYGFHNGRMVWLGALAPGSLEIRDPYELDDESAAAVLNRMATCTERLASALKKPAAQL
jgi:protein-tyrosine-phosphatase